jgi:Protein of unknown function (DUF2589)
MPDLVQELNSLEFGVYIGGPLQAAIKAQQEASLAQIDFIKDVGFVTTAASPTPSLRMVDFSFKKDKPNPNFGKTPAQLTAEGLPANTNVTDRVIADGTTTLRVPMLAMLTMPAIRIQEITIDFNAKLTSVETKNISTELGVNASLGLNVKWVNFKASTAFKRTTTEGVKVEKSYTMAVHVRAVNDEMPAGLERILTLLEENIGSTTV